MKKMRLNRLLAYLLAFCMMVPNVSMPAYAAEASEIIDISQDNISDVDDYGQNISTDDVIAEVDSTVDADDAIDNAGNDYTAINADDAITNDNDTDVTTDDAAISEEASDDSNEDEAMDESDDIDADIDEYADISQNALKAAIKSEPVSEQTLATGLYAFPVYQFWFEGVDDYELRWVYDGEHPEEIFYIPPTEHVGNVSIHDSFVFKFYNGSEWIPITNLDDYMSSSEGMLGRRLFAPIEGKTISDGGVEYTAFEFTADPYDKVQPDFWLAYSPGEIEDEYKLYFDFDMPRLYSYTKQELSYEFIIDEYQCDVSGNNVFYTLFDESSAQRKISNLRMFVNGDAVACELNPIEGDHITWDQLNSEESFHNNIVDIEPIPGTIQDTLKGFKVTVINPGIDFDVRFEGELVPDGSNDDWFFSSTWIKGDPNGLVFTTDFDKEEDGSYRLRYDPENPDTPFWTNEIWSILRRDMEFVVGYRHQDDHGDWVVDVLNDIPFENVSFTAVDTDSQSGPIVEDYKNTLEYLGNGLFRFGGIDKLRKISFSVDGYAGAFNIITSFPSTGFYSPIDGNAYKSAETIIGNDYTISGNNTIYIFHEENFEWVRSCNLRLYIIEPMVDYGEGSPGELIYSTYESDKDKVSDNKNFVVTPIQDADGNPAYKIEIGEINDFIDLEAVTYWNWDNDDPDAFNWDEHNHVHLTRPSDGFYFRYYRNEQDYGEYERLRPAAICGPEELQFAIRQGDDFTPYTGELIVKKQNAKGEWVEADSSEYEINIRTDISPTPGEPDIYISSILTFNKLGTYRIYNTINDDYTTIPVSLQRIGFYNSDVISDETYIGWGTAIKDNDSIYLYVDDEGEWKGEKFLRLYEIDPNDYDPETNDDKRSLIYSSYTEDQNGRKQSKNDITVERVKKDGTDVNGLYKITFTKVNGAYDYLVMTYNPSDPQDFENFNETWFNTGLAITDAALSFSSMTLSVGDSAYNDIKITPDNAYFDSSACTFTSSDESVVWIGSQSGRMEARSVGKAKITVSIDDSKAGFKKTLEYNVTVKAALQRVDLSFEDGSNDILTNSDKTIIVNLTPSDYMTQSGYDINVFKEDGTPANDEHGGHISWDTDEINKTIRIFTDNVEGKYRLEVKIDSIGDETPATRIASIDFNVVKATVTFESARVKDNGEYESFEGIAHDPIKLDMGQSLDLLGYIDTYKDGYRFLGFYNENNVELHPWTAYDGSFNKIIARFQEVEPETMYVNPIGDQVYTGKPIKPEVQVFDGDRWLQAGVDYKVAYSKNTNVGTATATVTGLKNYKGSRVVNFNILPINLAKADSNTFKIDITAMTKPASSKVQKLAPVLTYNGKKLAKKDYTVEYPDTTDGAYQKAGVYNVVIKCKGNYTGTFTIKETLINNDRVLISKAKITWPKKVDYNNGESINYNIATNEWGVFDDQIKITYKGKALQRDIDYYLRYSNDREPGDTYVSVIGINDFAGSKDLKFKIIGLPIKNAVVVSGLEDKEYTGDPIWPEIVLQKSKTDTTLLNPDEDFYYELSEDNTNVGKVNVTIYGRGKYNGTSVKKSFKILPLDASKSNKISVKMWTWDEGLDQDVLTDNLVGYYDTKDATVNLEVIYDYNYERYLRQGIDYKVKYTNNKAVGGTKTPTVTISFLKNYKGTLTKTFTIEKGSIGYCIADDVTYKDKPAKGKYEPKLYVFNDHGNELKKGKDYEIVKYQYFDENTATDFDGNMDLLKADDKGLIRMMVYIRGIGNFNEKRLNESDPIAIEYYLVPQEKSISKINFKIKDQMYINYGWVHVNSKDQITYTKQPAGFTNDCYYIDGFDTIDLKKLKGKAILVGDHSEGWGGIKVVQYKITAKPVDFTMTYQ
ncbi:MAG: hypothetical protein K5662_00200 [Lachnospiraceae bacterium]|nr:hypothetical protein [Lachnospiraceae bacterium]